MVMGSKTNMSSCKRHSSFSAPLFDIAKEYIGICSSYRSTFMITVPWKIWSGAPRISWAMFFFGWHSNQASLNVNCGVTWNLLHATCNTRILVASVCESGAESKCPSVLFRWIIVIWIVVGLHLDAQMCLSQHFSLCTSHIHEFAVHGLKNTSTIGVAQKLSSTKPAGQMRTGQMVLHYFVEETLYVLGGVWPVLTDLAQPMLPRILVETGTLRLIERFCVSCFWYSVWSL